MRTLVSRSVAAVIVLAVSAWAVTGDPLWLRTEPVRKPPVRPVAAGSTGAAGQYYVSPRGRHSARGTLGDPLDLETALSQTGPVGPGSTVWLRGGTYRGPFVSTLTGTPGSPIHVRRFGGERVIIDGAGAPTRSPLTVNGSDAWFWDFEVTNTDLARDRERGIGVNVFGPRVRLINLVVHDTGNGIGLWSPAVDAELYGNIIYDVGWQEHGEGKGHSIYVQNETGIKRIVDNVLFNGYSFGIHAYTEQGHIDNLYIQGNVAFNHGILAPTHELKSNILVGGRRVASLPTLIGNFTYFDSPDAGRGADLGYWAGCTGARVLRNYLAGGTPIRLRRCGQMTMTDNRLYGPVEEQTVRDFPNNEYRQSAAGVPTEVFVLPNTYQRGRATVVVFNWQRLTSIRADVSSVGFAAGETIHIRDVQDYFGGPGLETAYVPGRPVEIPMVRTTAAQPIGGDAIAHTTPEFGVYIVEAVHVRNRR